MWFEVPVHVWNILLQVKLTNKQLQVCIPGICISFRSKSQPLRKPNKTFLYKIRAEIERILVVHCTERK